MSNVAFGRVVFPYSLAIASPPKDFFGGLASETSIAHLFFLAWCILDVRWSCSDGLMDEIFIVTVLVDGGPV